jgi:hypothetical protein
MGLLKGIARASRHLLRYVDYQCGGRRARGADTRPHDKD